MNIQRTETNIREVCLAASLADIILRLCHIFFIIWELVFLVKYFVCMHDTWTLFQILERLFILTCIYLKNTSVKIIVLFVEDVFFVIVCLFSLFLVCNVITFISSLGCSWSCFKLSVELLNLFLIEVTDIFVLVEFFLRILLLDSKPQIISFCFTFTNCSVLLLASSYCSDFVSLSSLGRRNHLGVMMKNARVMSDFG